MGWRFRKSFSPFPGVRITLSPRGLSTSVGVGPLRFTVGSQGAAVTARIPGSGIAYHQPITTHFFTEAAAIPGTASDPPSLISPIPDEPRQVTPNNQDEIRSADTSELTSPGLSKFRELLTQSQQERRTLLPELQAATAQATQFEQEQAGWQSGWLLRRLFPGRNIRIRENATEAKARQDELQEQERLSRLQTQIDIPSEVRKAYAHLLDAFAVLTKCERKWDTVSRAAADQVRDRTTAAHSIDRKAVVFDVGICDLIESEWRVPHLANANGGDLYLYPCFVLLHISADAFALVDVSEVDIESGRAAFIEEEAVPADARIVRQTWKNANQDGSPDRRFANNYQIPVVEYGRLTITSPSGLNEEYMLSNHGAVSQFVSLWKAFKQAVTGATA